MHTLKSLVDVLRSYTEDRQDGLAYVFLNNGDTEDERWTYADLDLKARIIAAKLQSITNPGDRALLVYPPGLEYIAAFFGCLYAGTIAVPAYPPHPRRIERTLPRLISITQDATPKVALTNEAIQNNLEAIFEFAPLFSDVDWIATDTLDNSIAEAWKYPDVDIQPLAFLQYTSGSTATPKGVMVSHHNLMYNEAMIKASFAHDEHSTFVGWLPLYHDMGLIGNVLQPLYIGAPSILMPPVAFLQRPHRWLKAITTYKAHTSGGPNFSFDLCVHKISAEQKQELDLSSWKVAFNGAEPIRKHTIDAFTTAFAECGFKPEAFYPCYGLAEATLFVTGGYQQAAPTVCWVNTKALEQDQVKFCSAEDEQAQVFVSSGFTWMDQTVVIVHPETRERCADNQIGEVWVSGANVANGYLNMEETNSQVFQAMIENDKAAKPLKYMRTGDLGFIYNKHLYITGRHKDLIIIDGRNIYPQDIELTTEESHSALHKGCCAAFSIDQDGEERLVVVVELERQSRSVNPADPIKAIKRAIAQAHDINLYDVVLLETNTISKTSSGKIQRRICKTKYLNNTLEVIGAFHEQ